MTGNAGGITAAHYIYLLKDGEDLPRVWSAITRGAELAPSEPFSLGLTPEYGKHHQHGCLIVTRTGIDRREVCLGMLPDLAVIEIKYRGDPGTESEWSKVLERIESDRRDANVEDATTLGESSLLISGELSEDDLVAVAGKAFPDSHLLLSDVDPSIGGGDQPLWAFVMPAQRRARDYFVLAADDPDTLVESLLPEVDSIIKKLSKTAKFFAHQRQTIVKERAAVDKEVAAILHARVVSSNETYDPEKLEGDIASLSRMFGVLATDSQLVRQAMEQIEKDRHRLDHALSPILSSRSVRNEAADFFLTRYDSELANARAEGASLDFSRGNAQAAIEVVRTQVDLLRAGEEAALQVQTKEILDRSLLLQEERLALQVAAGFVEFVLIFYYTLKSWEGVAGHEAFDQVPPLLRLVVVAGVAAGATIGTHSLADTIQHKKMNKGVLFAAALIVISLTALVTLTIMNA